MPANPLICVWQAVYIRDGAGDSKGLRKNVLQTVTNMIFNELSITSSSGEFNELFPNENIDYQVYKSYLIGKLHQQSRTQYNQNIQVLESLCWNLCLASYQSKMFQFKEDNFLFWQVFNKMSEEGSYPPVISDRHAEWIANKIAERLQVQLQSLDLNSKKVTLHQLMKALELKLFTSRSLTSQIHKGIAELYSYMIRDVIKTGALVKRTRKNHSHWNNWLQRWFILTPGNLAYFEDPEYRKKKKDVTISPNSTIELMPDRLSSKQSLSGLFKITDEPYLEMELATNNKHERDLWVRALQDTVKAAWEGVTPAQRILKDRSTTETKT